MPGGYRGARIVGIVASIELSDDANADDGPKQWVDTQFAVTIIRADGGEECWESPTQNHIDIDLSEGPIEEQFDFIARSSAQDIELDLEQAGYRGRVARDELPITWRIGPRLDAHPSRIAARVDG